MSGMVQKKIGLGKYDIGQLTNLVEVSEDDGAMPGIDCSDVENVMPARGSQVQEPGYDIRVNGVNAMT
ncbi:hypothetical protein LTR37_003130 [Vermiconidia calcicola]|uniref:Uncharacterized protein n=1 Tax=Vermiconidia calcicola TaxID=1690605 RepID=A0ACC3NRF9_9PEZI|nr:hypothetical protein LTR37_003130 [Vermiconidia calcicola]